jgi:hypothetical protein
LENEENRAQQFISILFLQLTLTAATTVMFAELHWTPGVLAQAEDRCHRIGQQNAVNVLYFVNQNLSLSVDMQLWNMLGKKVETLGNVIDGCKDASLNAQVADGDTVRQGGGQSGQDELQSFFAEASLSDGDSKPEVPVKGTIMSFFQKQAESQKKAVASAPSKFATGGTSSTSAELEEFGKSKASTTLKPTLFGSATKNPRVDWACGTCTYENSKERPKSGWLTCEMCSSTYLEELEANSTVTPSPSNRKEAQKNKASDPIVLDILDSPLKRATKSSTAVTALDHIEIIDVRKGSSKQRKDIMTSPSDSDLIVIDDSPIKPASKKRTRAAPRVINLEDTPSRPNSKPSSPKASQPKALLTFSVSRNSGRITIHYASSGESSNLNFDIEQVVSKETADSLLDANVNTRSSSKPPSIVVDFDEDAVKRGNNADFV